MLRLLACFLLVATAFFAGCDSGVPESDVPGPEDDVPGPEDHVPGRIAVMKLRLENVEDGGDVTTITATDPDGDGSFAYSPDSLVFRRESLYEGTVEVLETAEGEDFVAAVRASPEEYLFNFSMRTDNGVESTAVPFDRETDYDPDGRDLWPVGLRFRVNVDSSSSESGLFTAGLRHYESGAKEDGSDQFVNIKLPSSFPVAVAVPPQPVQHIVIADFEGEDDVQYTKCNGAPWIGWPHPSRVESAPPGYGGTYSLNIYVPGEPSQEASMSIRFPNYADVPAGPDASLSFSWRRFDNQPGRNHTVILLDDDDGDGEHGPGDDTFEYQLPFEPFETYHWERVSIPLNDFVHVSGAQGVFDPEFDGNGGLVGVCLEADAPPWGSIRFRFDHLVVSEEPFIPREEGSLSGSP